IASALKSRPLQAGQDPFAVNLDIWSFDVFKEVKLHLARQWRASRGRLGRRFRGSRIGGGEGGPRTKSPRRNLILAFSRGLDRAKWLFRKRSPSGYPPGFRRAEPARVVWRWRNQADNNRARHKLPRHV